MMNSDNYNEADQCLIEEIEALKAIYISDIDVTCSASGRPTELKTTLYPSTANDINQYYVCLTLILKFPQNYPDERPMIELKNPRGLDEIFLNDSLTKCYETCDKLPGSPVIYEIIELLKDCLTNSNKPTGQCTICLFGFQSRDVFIYTQCYHHFHSHCLLRYCENLLKQWEDEEAQETGCAGISTDNKKEKQYVCPVCREPIVVELEKLKGAPPPIEGETISTEYINDPKFQLWKSHMKEEYQKQVAKGAIIDTAAEDTRFLIVTESSNTPPETTPASVENEAQIAASSKPQWSRDQPKYGRGKFIKRLDPSISKSNTAQYTGQASYNTTSLRGSQSVPKDMNSLRHPFPSQRSVRGRPQKEDNGIRSVPNPIPRPPPGFEPR